MSSGQFYLLPSCLNFVLCIDAMGIYKVIRIIRWRHSQLFQSQGEGEGEGEFMLTTGELVEGEEEEEKDLPVRALLIAAATEG